MTDRQRKMLHHALGLDQAAKPYRDYYSTHPRADTYADVTALVEAGYFTPGDPPRHGDLRVYFVTPAGAALFGVELPR